jgi:cyclopropane fatty-acyl-phospholipid synthase-like methyltransferase
VSENHAGNAKPTGTSIMMKLNDEYLALTAKLAHDMKIASYIQLNLRPGSRHLEIGSGNGHDTIALAELNPASSILGIDLNDDIVQVANQRVKDKGLTNLTHVTGDATFYPFNSKFHSMRAERVFQHLKDAEIVALVKRLATLAEQECVFSLVGIDWETLTCTISAKHRDLFRTIKQFLIDVSNINFVHTSIAAFEANGFATGDIVINNFTMNNFHVAMTVLNLENIASQLAFDSERFQSMRKDFIDGKHYFSFSGCTAPFVYRGR